MICLLVQNRVQNVLVDEAFDHALFHDLLHDDVGVGDVQSNVRQDIEDAQNTLLYESSFSLSLRILIMGRPSLRFLTGRK